ncbi:hypothetical protein M3P05_20525, partial [Sansalvadorimonas sp. 2012CJ34-2]
AGVTRIKKDMSKTSIKVISLGYLPVDFDRKLIKSLKSKLFQIHHEFESYSLSTDSDLPDWGYSDENILKSIPGRGDEDILIALTTVPLEDNYYTRRFKNNTVVFTFHEISDYLRFENIPIENVIKRLIYSYCLVFLRSRREIPVNKDITDFTHDETRGCIYDMNGLKEDIIHSCHNPQICDDCTQRLLSETVASEIVNKAKSEIKKIKKTLYFRILDWVKKHPILAIIFSSLWAVTLGVCGSFIYALIFSNSQ